LNDKREKAEAEQRAKLLKEMQARIDQQTKEAT
jgi:hypothetical protein